MAMLLLRYSSGCLHRARQNCLAVFWKAYLGGGSLLEGAGLQVALKQAGLTSVSVAAGGNPWPRGQYAASRPRACKAVIQPARVHSLQNW